MLSFLRVLAATPLQSRHALASMPNGIYVPSLTLPQVRHGPESMLSAALPYSSAGLSKTFAGIKVTLIGSGGSMPGGKCWPRGLYRTAGYVEVGPSQHKLGTTSSYPMSKQLAVPIE